MSLKCLCGNEITIPVNCIICGNFICSKCVIQNDLDLCINCINEQNILNKQKEDQNKCTFCDEQSLKRHCNCCYPQKELSFCENHHNKCVFCDNKICSDRKSCKNHDKLCMNCSADVKLFVCIECGRRLCTVCFDTCFDAKIKKWNNKVICKSHSIKCKRRQYMCPGYFYKNENNTCDNLMCKSFCCKVCDSYKPGRHGCSNHMRLCLHNLCFKRDVESNMKTVFWKYKNQKVCKICFKNIKNDIKNLLLVLNRYGFKFQRDLIEKIII